MFNLDQSLFDNPLLIQLYYSYVDELGTNQQDFLKELPWRYENLGRRSNLVVDFEYLHNKGLMSEAEKLGYLYKDADKDSLVFFLLPSDYEPAFVPDIVKKLVRIANQNLEAEMNDGLEDKWNQDKLAYDYAHVQKAE